MNIERKDWENVKRSAMAGLKQATIDTQVFTNILCTAEKELKKLPEEEEKKPLGI